MGKIFEMKRIFVEMEDELFEIIKVLPSSREVEMSMWKEYLNTDKVLRKDDKLYFCRKIEEANIIEEK